MNFKKFNGTTWETVQHKIYGSGTDSLTAFPAMIQAAGDPLTDYTIYGNTEQNGTPTPEAPVDVVGCGERTGNLFDKSSTVIYNAFLNEYDMWYPSDDSRSIVIPVNGGIQYTLSVPEAMSIFRICEATQEPAFGNSYSRIVRASSPIDRYTFTTQNNTKYIIFQGNSLYVGTWFNGLMLNLGSTALPYEPYGYKLPITVNGTEYPIYLGQAPTTRRIKKLVLTGGGRTGKKAHQQVRIIVLTPNSARHTCIGKF